MDTCSFFIQNKAIFGSYPNSIQVEELEKKGVRYFVNLTFNNESKITPYTTQYHYIHYPIPDRRTPTNWKTFACFIVHISSIIRSLEKGELIYIHCKGGHGRSGVVVACILCYIFNIQPKDALSLTTKYHSHRNRMREKWRRIGSPQTFKQKNFVCNFFKPLYFYRSYDFGRTAGFSNFSNYSVTLDDIGTFQNAEAAYQAHKNLKDSEYVQQQLESQSGVTSRELGKHISPDEDWEQTKYQILYKILYHKFNQHPDIQIALVSTGLRPLIHGSLKEGIYQSNILGELLTKLRIHFYEKDLILSGSCG